MHKQIIELDYWKCNFPMTRSVRPLVGHNFLKVREVALPYSEHLWLNNDTCSKHAGRHGDATVKEEDILFLHGQCKCIL